MKHKYKIEPQPRLPILSLFRGEEESYTNKPGWYYQSPVEDTPGLRWNRTFQFGGNEPPNEGEAFKSGIVEEVWAVPEKDGVYWEVIITPVECGENGIKRFTLIDATFKPQRTDDLKPDVADWIGWRGVWQAMWIVEDGDYVGQWAFGIFDISVRCPFLWAPRCDLEIHKVITTPPVSWK